MSSEVIVIIAMLITQGLHLMGVEVGSEQLTQVITTLVAVVSGIYLWHKHLKAKETLVGANNVNIFGGVKN